MGVAATLPELSEWTLMIIQHLQHELLAFNARFSSVKGSPV